MNVRLLIDAIMQQTTVLIGRLSTSAGIRAPLSRVAEGVFLNLARELDAQGVRQRVAADMFGLALRTYQKKVRRLAESESVRHTTLWQAVLGYISEQQRARRGAVLERFHADGEKEVGSVLGDLVESGLVYQTGQGAESIYGLTTEADLRFLSRSDEAETLAPAVWAAVHRRPGLSLSELAADLQVSPDAAERAVTLLVDEGRLERRGELIHAATLLVPVGDALGWEVAVFDHFRAVANAIAAKVQSGRGQSGSQDVVGGATLSFLAGPGHPLHGRVTELLREVRSQVNALWNEVEAHNAQDPGAPRSPRTFFYFGQYVEEAEDRKAAP